jgi:hypothetical protein
LSTGADSPRSLASRALAWSPLVALLVAALLLLVSALRREPPGDVVTAAPAPGGATTGQSLLDQVPPDGGLVAARWQATRVLTKSVTLLTSPSPGFVRARVPAGGGTFETAVGINPERLPGLASGPFRFTVAALTARAEDGRGERKLLREEQIDPAREVGDRSWIPIHVDLDHFAGQEVMLVLSVSTANLVDAPSDLAGWAEPRVVPHPAATSAPAGS